MNRETFFKYAHERPEPPEPSVYNLQIFYYCDNEEGYHQNTENGQWEYKIYSALWRTYTTKEKALEALHDYLNKKHYSGEIIHSAMIWRTAVDIPVSQHIDGHLGKWLYDSNGNLIEQSVCDGFHMQDEDHLYGKYLGRTESEIRFQEGDIVEIHPGDTGQVYLAIINGLPRTIEEMWEMHQRREQALGPRIKKFSIDLFADIMADFYFIAGNPEDEFDPDISPCYIMKPTFEPPEEAIRELKEWYDAWKARVENDDEE